MCVIPKVTLVSPRNPDYINAVVGTLQAENNKCQYIHTHAVEAPSSVSANTWEYIAQNVTRRVFILKAIFIWYFMCKNRLATDQMK